MRGKLSARCLTVFGLTALFWTAGLGVSKAASRPATATCTIYWTGKASNDWDTNANWSLTNGGSSANRVPGRSDYVCMSSSPARSTVVLASGESIVVAGIDFVQSSSVLEVTGTITVGTATVADPSTIENLQVAGTLYTATTIAAPSLSLQSGGEIAGSSGTVTVPTGGTLSISGGELASGIDLVNQGAASVAQATQFELTQGATLDNYGTLAVTDSSSISSDDVNSQLVNHSGGSLSYAGSSSSASATISAAFDNFGAVSVTNGTLELSGPSSDSSDGDTGSYNVSASAVLLLDGDSRILTGKISFPGAGPVDVTGYMYLGAGNNLTIPNLEFDGTLVGRGTLTIPSTGSATLSGGSLQNGLHFVNQGTLTEAADADVQFEGNAELENEASMTLADNAEVGDSIEQNGMLVNDAGASLSYSGSASSAESSIYVPFDNYGAVVLTKGTLNVNAGSSSESTGDSGSYSVASAAGLAFNSGTRNFAAGATFPGPGQIAVAGELNVNPGNTLSFPNLLLSYGQINGRGSVAIPSGATATLSNGTLSGGVHFINNGTTTVTTNSVIGFEDASSLTNNGTLALADDASVGNEFGNANGIVANAAKGKLSFTGSANNSTATVYTPFDNYGALSVGRGGLDLAGGSSSSSGGDSGSFNVAASATLTFSGSIQDLAPSVSFPGSGQVIDESWLDFLGSATLPNLAIDGTVEVSPGAVVTASVASGPSGSLQIDGAKPADFGKFVAKNALALASMDLAVNNPSFTPACGSSIVATQAKSISGTFGNVSDSNLPSGATANPVYSATQAKVVIACSGHH